ncbi:Adenylate-forming reductase [Exophiala dermatitidis]
MSLTTLPLGSGARCITAEPTAVPYNPEPAVNSTANVLKHTLPGDLGCHPRFSESTERENAFPGPADPDSARGKQVQADASSARSASSLVLEKHPIPEIAMEDKKYNRVLRNLRWTILSVYRRLNLMVLAANVIAMIVLALRHELISMSPESAATAVSINLTVAVLIRQELVINALFWTFGKCPEWLPLSIRRMAAKIYHLGGVHSGAGMSAVLWFAFFNVAIVRVLRDRAVHTHQTVIPVITVILDILLLSIIVTAHPAVRTRMHNMFEMVHRFGGWTAVALFWIQFGLLADERGHDPAANVSLQEAIAYSPVFWALVVTTVSLALPWVWLRKVPVHAEPLSDHAVRLHFTHTNLPLCAAPRISDSPLVEWHAFAGIPEEDGQGFSVLVSKAGDWTSRLIKSPPTKLWVRGIPAMGVLHVAPIFKRMVLVATGSGIGPILSLLCKGDVSCRILWSTPDPEVTYSTSVIEHVRRADPEAIIINTTAAGRPNLVRLTYEMYVSSGAEAVFIISNPRVTRNVVYALESRGVPIFAPIFDS